MSRPFTFKNLVLSALLAGAAFSTFAAGPMVKTQAPGYYRVMLGDFEVTALSDGTVKLPVKDLLTNTTPAKVGAALKRSFLPDAVETSVNAYLVNTGSKLVLIDTGAARAPCWLVPRSAPSPPVPWSRPRLPATTASCSAILR